MKRQGDLLFVPTNKIPGQKKQKSKVLAFGEATGHAHVLSDGEVYKKDGETYLDIPKKGAKVTHEDHDAVDLAVGKYKMVRQREYKPRAKPGVVAD